MVNNKLRRLDFSPSRHLFSLRRLSNLILMVARRFDHRAERSKIENRIAINVDRVLRDDESDRESQNRSIEDRFRNPSNTAIA